MKVIYKATIASSLILFLFWAWPNFIHEPLHLLALKTSGGSGTINLDLQHFPAHPSITRTTELYSVTQGLYFLLLPSIVSIIILITLLFFRTKSLFLNFILPIYLTTDLFINITGYNNGISDFRFLIAIPFLTIILEAITILIGLILLYKGVQLEMAVQTK